MSEMRCKRCGANESRIDGFCSIECRDKFDYEEEITDLEARIAELESLVDELKPYRDGYEGEFLEPTDDRFYLIRHTNGQLVTTRKVDNHEDINFLGWGAKGKPRRYWRLPEVHE